ncbi:heterokaryon incompatibility protein-domain-containing protein [Hypoxylon cercidicola]|nr:heterokaryon incompatibility protein-domain-containing protein [Hypoxylon cercidicola]
MESNIPQRPRSLSIEGLDQEVKRLQLSVSSTTLLCSACSAVQWSSLANNQPFDHSGIMVMKVHATHDELRVSACPVCRALALIKPATLDGQVCSLKAFGSQPALAASSYTSPRPTSWKQCTVLGIVPEGSSYTTCRELGFFAVLGREPADFEFGPRRILPGSVDYSHIKSVISFCVEKHLECCFHHETTRVDGLRVIDCVTKNVVEAPEGSQYLALSYVWGDRGHAAAITGDSFSPVVEDSITVTMELGFRYLWVDRHCIGQDEADKHHMIAQMGRIYSNAFLTIIAAAGADAQYGLPGAGKRKRVEQLETTVDDCTLLQIFPVGPSSIKDTKWASRGWTYQEGYLSKRRLIFTDQQVIYLCNGLFAPESVVRPLRRDIFNVYLGNRPFWDLFPRASIFTGNAAYTPSHEPQSLLDHITEYTRRQLSYEVDSLDAFKGVLASYETDKRSPIRHLWGIPVQGESGPFFSLLWYHKSVATRRSGFPSWSWAGWAGGVSWLSRHWNRILNDHKCRITFSGEDNRQQPIWPSNLQSSASSPLNTAPRQLQITSPTVTLRIETFSLTQEQLATTTKIRFGSHSTSLQKRRADGHMAVFRISPHARVAALIFFDNEVKAGAHLTGLVFSLGNTHDHGHAILVLQENEHHYERTGLISIIHGTDSDLPMLYLDNEGQILDEVWIEGQDDWVERAEEMTIRLH